MFLATVSSGKRWVAPEARKTLSDLWAAERRSAPFLHASGTYVALWPFPWRSLGKIGDVGEELSCVLSPTRQQSCRPDRLELQRCVAVSAAAVSVCSDGQANATTADSRNLCRQTLHSMPDSG
jgi:hypothetical protein